MPTDDGTTSAAHEDKSPAPAVLRNYLFPVLATITAMSLMGAAAACIGMWRDVGLIRQSMAFLGQNFEDQKKEYKEGMRRVENQLQEHEVRLTRGKL
jgi:hypothetical protein